MTNYKFWPGSIIFFIALASLLVVAVGSIPLGCGVRAAVNVPTDFCYRATIAVTNTTGGTITNKPVRFLFDSSAAIANGWMNSEAWDIVPSTTGNVEVEVMTQDVDSAISAWWLVVPSLANNTTQNFIIYLGNDEQRRDNGVYFDSADEMTAVDDPAFDISNNLTLTIELDVLDVSGQTSELAGHWDSNEGYRIRFINNGGTLEIQAQVDAFTINATWPGAVGDQETVRMRFVAAAGTDLFLEHFTAGAWAVIASSDTDLAAITPPTAGPAFTWGTSLSDTVVRNTLLEDGSGIVARWLFDGVSGTETSAVTPNYAGTFLDVSSNTHTATYAFTRSIALTPAITGPVILNSAPQVVTITKTGASLLGDAFGGYDLGASVTANTNIPFYNIINTAAEDSGLPIKTMWSMLFIFIAVGLLIIGTAATKQFWVGALLASLPVFYGTIAQVIDPWFIVIWIASIVLIFGVGKWAEGK